MVLAELLLKQGGYKINSQAGVAAIRWVTDNVSSKLDFFLQRR